MLLEFGLPCGLYEVFALENVATANVGKNYQHKLRNDLEIEELV
jgi:hypothetical protein